MREIGAGIKKIVIVGGGTAGWMAAASLAHFLRKTQIAITVIESPEMGTVGVGEATIPPIMDLIRALGLDEQDLLKRCDGTYKLGIRFNGWTSSGSDYMHPFGQTGYPIDNVDFSACWLSQRLNGALSSLADYSLMASAAQSDRFMHATSDRNSPLGHITYALHFDAVKFADVLRGYACARDVTWVQAKVEHVLLDSQDGHIDRLILDNGTTIDGDLFIDCSGFRGLLIGGALNVGYHDWRHWLPCDRAVAVQCERGAALTPYTISTARDAGWQWRIPLQHRVGNGYVYCSTFQNDAEAADQLLSNLEGSPLTTPRQLTFVTGRRRKFWHKNCVSLGLASGFLEPLESTSIHLVQRGLALLLKHFPGSGFLDAAQDQYNATLGFEYERIRDFLMLHYIGSDRRDSPFWRAVQDLAIPESLADRIALYKHYGRIIRDPNELFPAQSWLYVFTGLGIFPAQEDPLAARLDPKQVARQLAQLKAAIAESAATMPDHEAYLARLC